MLQLFLQRIFEVGSDSSLKKEYGEKLNNELTIIVRKKIDNSSTNHNLWNTDWLDSKNIKSILSNSNLIINDKELKNAKEKHIIPPSEIDIFGY